LGVERIKKNFFSVLISKKITTLIVSSYVLRLFKKGYKNEFEQEDLYDVPGALKSEKLGAVLDRQWKEQKNPKLIRLLCSSFGICYFSLGLMKLLANTLFL
jgi:ATP-binding cassette subfamily C (CFTR/MRP) protein 4